LSTTAAARHIRLAVLSEGPVWRQRRSDQHATTVYRRRGNLVFNAGTCWWNVASFPPGFQNPPRRASAAAIRIQRIARNIPTG
jgi:hypothetical protein